MNEILMFGGAKSNDICIYNRVSNKIKKNQVGLSHKDDSTCIASYAIHGNTKHTLIILWGNFPSWNRYYGIFNCKTMQFDKIIDATQWECGIWHEQSVHRVNNLLFRITRHEIVIHDVSDETSPKQIETNIRIGIADSAQGIMSVEKDKKDSDILNVKFVLFGSLEKRFYRSFYKINIRMNGIYIIDYRVDELSRYRNHEWYFNSDVAGYMGLYAYLQEFTYHWYMSRYLIIVGGDQYAYNNKETLDSIACIDIKKKAHYRYKLPARICSHESMLIHENNDIYLYVFGGIISLYRMHMDNDKDKHINNHNDYDNDNKDDDDVCNYNLRWKLRLTKQIDWNIERLIWIGYYKNLKDKNIDDQKDQGIYNVKECEFGQIPKDVIKSVLSFIRRQFLFS